MIFFLVGLISGVIGGMGIGGGTILIPSLIFLTSLKQQIVQSINLISFVPVSIVALVVHYRNKNILFKISCPLIFFGIFGTYIGSKLALNLPSILLRKWFGVFLLVMGLYEIFFKDKRDRKK